MNNPIAQLLAMSDTMTPAQRNDVRTAFNRAISEISDPDAKAWGEIAREWITNPTFREKLSDYTYAINTTEGR